MAASPAPPDQGSVRQDDRLGHRGLAGTRHLRLPPGRWHATLLGVELGRPVALRLAGILAAMRPAAIVLAAAAVVLAVPAQARQPPPAGADPDVPRAQRPARERALPGAVRPSPPTSRARTAWLAAHGYQAVTLQRVFDSWRGAATLPAKPVVLSFDDGYLSDVKTALPVLKARRWPGVLNLEVANLKPVWGIRPPGVRKLIAAGWEIDAHTLTHPDLTKVDAARLRDEVAGSRAAIRKQFHVPVNFFCYPAGRYDAAVIAAVQQAGYLGGDDDELRAGEAGRAVHAGARARRRQRRGERPRGEADGAPVVKRKGWIIAGAGAAAVLLLLVGAGLGRLPLQAAPGTRHPRLVDGRVRPDGDGPGPSAAEAAAEAEAGTAGRARPRRLADSSATTSSVSATCRAVSARRSGRSGRSTATICSSSRRRSPTAARTSRTTRACSTRCRRRPAARAGSSRPGAAPPRRPRSRTGSSTWPSSTCAGRGVTPATRRRERPGSTAWSSRSTPVPASCAGGA